MWRGLKWFALAGVLIISILITAAWWASSSPQALQWLVAEAVQRSNGTLSFEGVSGSLFGRVKVHQLIYSDVEVRIVSRDVALELSRNALLQGRLEVVSIEAVLVDVHTTPSDKPPKAPDSLALPFDIDIQRVRIGQLRLGDQSGQTINNLSFSYRGGKAGHAIRQLVADLDWGRLNGELTIDARRPFALAGQLQLDKPNEWNAQAVLNGDLLTTNVALRATARGAIADAKAQIAAFDPRWLHQLHAHAEKINTAAFVAGFPESSIAINITGASTQHDWPAGTVTLSNQMAGSLTQNRLPLIKLTASYAMQNAAGIALTNLVADLDNGGKISGKARIAEESSLDLVVSALNLRALHTPLRATRLNGTIKAELSGSEQKVVIKVAERGVSIALNGTRHGDAVTLKEFRAQVGPGTLQGSGKLSLAKSQPYDFQARIDRFDPAAFGDYPAATINGNLDVNGALAPQWRANIALSLARSLFRGEPMAGNVIGEITAQGVRNLKANLAVGANRLHADGSYGRSGDALAFMLDARQLSQLDADMAGSLSARGQVNSDAKRPQMNIDITGSGLAWQKGTPVAALHLHADGTLAHHTATMTAQGQDFDLNARAEGGWHTTRGWSGSLASLENKGIYPMQLMTPLPVTYANGRYSAGPGQVSVDGGKLTLTTLTWRAGKLDSSGEVANFPVAPLLAIAGTPAPLTTLRVGGVWSIAASPELNGRLTLKRESGDVVTPGDTAIALGIEQLGVDVQLANGSLNATLQVLAKTLNGRAHATASAMTPEGILKLDGKFDVASLRVFDPLLGSQASLRGSATVNVTGSGTLGTPQLSGSLAAANLGIEAPQYGVRLHSGTLLAYLDDKILTLREFSIRGDEGTLSATGSMARAVDGEAHLAWRAEHLRVLNRPDMRLKVDGSGTVALANKKLVLRGALTADEGRFEFDSPKVPRLADDIVIVGRSQQPARSTMRTSFQTALLDIDVALDAGKRLHIAGAGLDTDLRGKINLKSNRQGVLEARGVLSSVNGIYFVLGQRLEIDRGRLIFDGPIDNPALDISAKRKGLAVEAGVEVTGTVRVPSIQLISDPPVSDSEKLAWLTLGHGLQDSTGADLALLQTAAAVLIGSGNSVPITQQIANKIGLDEFSLKGSGQASSQVAALGKRLSDKLYLEYQQGLTTASTVLQLSYALSRSLSLRLETGFKSGLGLYFTRSYD